MRIVLGLLGLSPFAAIAVDRLIGDMIAAVFLVALALAMLIALLAPDNATRSGGHR